MVRNYKRKKGARSYKDYTEDHLQEAIKKVKEGKLTQAAASRIYNIHENTLRNKIRGNYGNNHGHQTALTPEEEKMISQYIITLSIYGFPVNVLELRHIVKGYLDKTRRVVPCFKNNFPKKDWVYGFLKRNREVSQRVARNISLARAKVSEETINDFFDHLEEELKDVPVENIYNYDETNLQDDPGDEKVLTKRGLKYPENIRNASKACTSLMICGDAAGGILPPYIVYKSERMHAEWTEHGPPEARYNRTESGWFDGRVFEDWFFSQALPALKKKSGIKVLIGDNLSSHISITVLQSCKENNIKFIALPPNATHWLQPLDVAFFRPMKAKWRALLSRWKDSKEGAKSITVPKTKFPELLAELMETLTEDKSLIISGFRKSGITPLNRSQALSKLPKNILVKEASLAMEETFLQQLENKRKSFTEKKPRRKTQINIPAGKSISAEEIEKLKEDQRQEKEKELELKRAATEKKKEDRRIAAEKQKEEKRIAAEIQKEEKRIAAEIQKEEKRIAAERKKEEKRKAADIAKERRREAAKIKKQEQRKKIDCRHTRRMATEKSKLRNELPAINEHEEQMMVAAENEDLGDTKKISDKKSKSTTSIGTKKRKKRQIEDDVDDNCFEFLKMIEVSSTTREDVAIKMKLPVPTFARQMKKHKGLFSFDINEDNLSNSIA